MSDFFDDTWGWLALVAVVAGSGLVGFDIASRVEMERDLEKYRTHYEQCECVGASND